MMRVVYGAGFLKSARALPIPQQQKLAKLVERLAENPYHPLLHTKRLSGELIGLLSFRITRDWRVVFYFMDADTIQLLHVGNRKDIYRSFRG